MQQRPAGSDFTVPAPFSFIERERRRPKLLMEVGFRIQ